VCKINSPLFSSRHSRPQSHDAPDHSKIGLRSDPKTGDRKTEHHRLQHTIIKANKIIFTFETYLDRKIRVRVCGYVGIAGGTKDFVEVRELQLQLTKLDLRVCFYYLSCNRIRRSYLRTSYSLVVGSIRFRHSAIISEQGAIMKKSFDMFI